MSVPIDPLVYHITHVDNLPAIVAAQGLWSDAAMVARGGPTTAIGMSRIKARRLELPVHCHDGLMVGACVPFYFCPRSVMLYLLHKGNHPDVIYRGGQDPIVHLEARLAPAIDDASDRRRRWAFTPSNAGARYAAFRSDLAGLADLDWGAIANEDWRDPGVRERKQAELLIEEFVAFSVIGRIGVRSAKVAAVVQAHLAASAHRPEVHVLPAWYY